MERPNLVRISRLPEWQKHVIRKYFPRRKLLDRSLYEAIMNLEQIRCEESQNNGSRTSQSPEP